MGSSRISTAGSASRARARASRWCSPPDTAVPWVPTGVSHPSGRPIQGGRPARAAASARLARRWPPDGLAQVVSEGRVEHVRVLRASADHGPYIVGRVAGQVVAVEGAAPRGRSHEPEQHGGEGGLAAPFAPISAIRRPGGRSRPTRSSAAGPSGRYRTWRRVAAPGPDRGVAPAARRGSRTGSGASGNGGDPAGGDAGLVELDGGRGQGGNRLERGERGQGEHGQRHPGQRAGPGGGDAEQQDRPTAVSPG